MLKNKNQKGLALSASKGFSMLEVLVVIGILGVLSSVVFVSINSVRIKSDDTTIKASLSTIRAKALSYFSLNNNYGTATVASATTLAACSTANTLFSTSANSSAYPYIEAAELAADGSATWVATCAVGKLSADTNATTWAVAVPLKTQNIVSVSSGTDYWCVDSVGNANTYDTASLGGGSTALAKCS